MVTKRSKICMPPGASLLLSSAAIAVLQCQIPQARAINIVNNNTFNVPSGSENVGTITGTGNTNVSSSASLTATSIQQNALIDNGSVTINATPVTAGPGPRNTSATTSVLGALTIAGGATPTGKLNLNNNQLVISNGGTSALSAVETDIAYARDGGAWDQPGITSANAQAAHAATGFDSLTLGDILNSTLATPYTTFGGQGVSPNDVLVMFTYGGDANLNGVVNGDDYFQIDQGFVNHYTGWINGDFNHDGVVNGDDYFIIDSNFINQSGQLAASEVRAHAAEFGPSYLSQFSAAQLAAIGVPEPTSLALLSVGGLGLVVRRRRSATRP